MPPVCIDKQAVRMLCPLLPDVTILSFLQRLTQEPLINARHVGYVIALETIKNRVHQWAIFKDGKLIAFKNYRGVESGDDVIFEDLI